MKLQLEEIRKCVNHLTKERERHLEHRVALVDIWAPAPGDKVLEVGCGQGDTTVVLAAAVGKSGRVLAVDNAPPDDGSPVNYGDAQAFIMSSILGEQIQFFLSTNLLDPKMDFPDRAFELAVFSHSSWFISSPGELHRLFSRVRPWSRRLAYAEWDIRPRSLNQIPHMIAALSQLHIQAIWSQPPWSWSPTGNIRSLILPAQARLLAQTAGWAITDEEVIDTSTQLPDGVSGEVNHALYMAQQLIDSSDAALSEYVRDAVSSEVHLLKEISNQPQNMSLCSYSFIAE